MEYTSAVTVCEAVHDLLEYDFCLLFSQALLLLNVLEKITATRILHDHEEVLRALKDLK